MNCSCEFLATQNIDVDKNSRPNIRIQKNLNEVQSSFWTFFSQSIWELAKCHHNIPYEQSDVSEYLAYRNILKSIAKRTEGKNSKKW